MNIEEERLRTFREWPANAAIDPARLAKAGFYYTGHILEVQCFLCGTRISDWNYGDQAMVRHRLKSPDCPFVLAPADTPNVPLVPAAASISNVAAESTAHCRPSNSQQSSDVKHDPSLGEQRGPSEEYTNFGQRLQSFKNWPIPSIVNPKHLALAGFYYLQNKDMVECAFCRGVLMNWKAGDDPDCEHRMHFPNCDFYTISRQDDLFGLVRVISRTSMNMTELGIQRHHAPYRPEYATYEKRLQTFRGWPKNLNQTPEMLAEAGFYYGGCDDQVRCFHCDGGLRNWQPTDDVWVEHAQWFEKCGFVNLVLGHEFVSHCASKRTPLDLSDITGVKKGCAIDESLSSTSQSGELDITSVADVVETSVATVPQTSEPNTTVDIETAVASFSTVPQTIESDTTEHTQMILASLLTVPQTSEPDTTVDTETTVASPTTVLQPSIQITNAAVEELLETSPAKTALEIGLHVGRVKRALKKRMERYGRPYTDVVQLIQDVLYDQVMEEDNILDNSASNSPTSELNNLFNQVTVQMTNNSANENSTQESDVPERDPEIPEKKKTDNESDDLMSLQEENRKLKEARLCKVCMDHELAIVFLPCGHLATCNNCAPALASCPLCRLEISAYVRVFLS